MAIAAVVIIVLLLMNGFLLYKYLQKSKDMETQTLELNESQKLLTETDKQYEDALAELEAMRTGSEELNQIIDQQKTELAEQKARIDKLIRGGGSLDRARAEIKNLKTQVAEYTARIQQLKAENENLRGENDQLTERTESLSANLDEANTRNQALVGSKDSLAKEQQKLAADRDRLSGKVTVASVVKVENVNTTGMKKKGKDKNVKKRYAKNVDFLKVCFTTAENKVTDPGEEQFYVRIISPVGVVMAIDEGTSGKFYEAETGEEIRYTTIIENDYGNQSEQVCFDYAPVNPTFTKGKYQVEVFNKKYFAGSGEFQLK